MRAKAFELNKYINKLKVAKAPAYVVGQEKGLGLKPFFHPNFIELNPPSKEIQSAEFYGNMNNDHPYLSEEYKHLLLNIKEIDAMWSNEKNLDKRVELCKNTMNFWKTYINSVSLPEEEFKVREGSLIKLEEIWMRFKVLITNIEKK